MANSLNDIAAVKGKPLRVHRVQNRDEERIEQEYARRTNKVREEISAQRVYLKSLYDALVAAGITGLPEPPE